MTDDNPADERFRPTGGRFAGIVALVVCAIVAVAVVLDPAPGTPWAVVAGCGTLAVLAWATLLRPSVSTHDGDVVLRGSFTTVRIPLVAVEEIAVRQFLAVAAGGRRYTNPSIGRSRRRMMLDERSGKVGLDTVERAQHSYAYYVEDRINERVREACEAAGVKRRSDEQRAFADGITRVWAVPELAVLLVTALLVLVFALV